MRTEKYNVSFNCKRLCSARVLRENEYVVTVIVPREEIKLVIF